MPSRLLSSPSMHRAAVLALALAAACDGPPTPADRMRDAYAPTQAVTVGGFAWEVEIALRPDVVYAAGIQQLVQVDRATGDVHELLNVGSELALYQITADDTHVYVVQGIGSDNQLVRIPKGGGPRETVIDDSTFPGWRTSFLALATHGGAAYALAYQEQPGTAETARGVIVEIPADGSPVELAPAPIAATVGFVAGADGLYAGDVAGQGSRITRVPYTGGAPEVVWQSPDLGVRDLAVDDTGVYWTAGPIVAAFSDPAHVWFRPYGGAPHELAVGGTQGDFSVNELGFYWADYDAHAIRAVTREDLAGGDFELIDIVDRPGNIEADDRALAYWSNNDDGDIDDLELHVVPRAP